MMKEIVGFSHQDVWVTNPYESSCGRFEADPIKDYGFEEYHTGGGCMALVKWLDDGRSIMVTEDAVHIPSPDANPEDILIVLYDKEGECIALNTLAEAIAAIEGRIK